MTTVWVAQRVYERRIVYENVFSDKDTAKEKLADKQGGQKPEDFEWEGLNYENDESVKATKGLESDEKLVVKRYTV